MNPAPVGKPANAGQGINAIANTRSTWVNLRSGPGEQYTAIDRVYDNTLARHFPPTMQGKWVWLEQYGRGGWVHTDYVRFDPIPTTIPSTKPTPYDGAIAIWHWEGDAVQQSTIEELVMTIKASVPNVKQLWVKTSDGPAWQGQYDSKKSMSIDGPQSLDRWATVLNIYQIELHAWCIPTGTNIDRETQIIIQTCNHPAVKSLILDIEPDPAYYWNGGKAAIKPFMTRLRQGITKPNFHIGFCPDPRPWHYNDLFPEEWAPYIDSIHPQTYWATFGMTPEEALDQVYNTWRGLGKPIIPALQAAAPAGEILAAHTLATQRYGAKGLSWWRWGVVGPVEFKAINLPITVQQPTPTPAPTPTPQPQPDYGSEILVTPDSQLFSKGTYTGKEEFSKYTGSMGWTVYYKPTEPRSSKVWAQWAVQLPESGKYQVEAYIHQPYATTVNARYKIHGVKGQSTEVIVAVNQALYTNKWAPLGVFDFDKSLPNSGRVFLNDVTNEQGQFVIFDAMRWRRVVQVDPHPQQPSQDGELIINGVYYADGYDSPVGTQNERRAATVWPAGWRDAAPFAQPYSNKIAVHTGADLTFGSTGDEDRGLPVSATASGIVVFVGEARGWGKLIVIKHDPLVNSAITMQSRYAHLDTITVKVGDRVRRGQQIGTIGGTRGIQGKEWSPHLHFDLCLDSTLESDPENWPSANRPKPLNMMTAAERDAWLATVADEIRRHYVDPKTFILANRPMR